MSSRLDLLQLGYSVPDNALFWFSFLQPCCGSQLFWLWLHTRINVHINPEKVGF